MKNKKERMIKKQFFTHHIIIFRQHLCTSTSHFKMIRNKIWCNKQNMFLSIFNYFFAFTRGSSCHTI
uniref:Uncharacterized protein n=1 Tax=Meloidogyne enterolobii TaxID=390850 RepID=A0A6V7URD7_MELEN|nr:unnamed protein product [Meloidogyne enterolobii]